MLAFLEHFPGKLLLMKKMLFWAKMINLSQNSKAYSIPYSRKMIIFCFITPIKLFTLLLYYLHVSLGLQMIKKKKTEDLTAKKSITIEHFIGGNKRIMCKSHAEINSFQYPPTLI